MGAAVRSHCASAQVAPWDGVGRATGGEDGIRSGSRVQVQDSQAWKLFEVQDWKLFLVQEYCEAGSLRAAVNSGHFQNRFGATVLVRSL
jgi:hypothetical protein